NDLRLLLRHRIGYLDSTRDDVPFSPLYFVKHWLRDQVAIIFIQRVADPISLHAKLMNPALEATLDHVLHRVEDRYVNAFDHAGQDEPGFNPVLIRVYADRQLVCVFGCVKDSETRVSGRLENDVGATLD